MFKDLLNYFHQNQLFSKQQSGFLPGDSYISQLLPIEINSFFYYNQSEDVRVFLDISKSFEKLWPEGTLLKLETSGVKGKTLHLLINYLSKHDQRLVPVDKFLHGSRSGVRKGSMPDPLMLLYFPFSKFLIRMSQVYI